MMRTVVRIALVVLAASVGFSGCSGNKSPTGPSNNPPTTNTPPAQTRVIDLDGTMAFGNIQLGQSFAATLQIRNNGNAPLTITGMQITSGLASVFTSSWTDGTVPPGISQTATIKFTPAAAQTYSGTLTLNGDFTSGTNTIAISGRGVVDGLPLFERTGTGNTVLDGMPAYVTRVRVIGTYTRNSSNFVVRVNGRLVVNELLGTGWSMTRYDGTHILPAGAGTIEITNSSGVAWSITESR